MLKRIIEFIKNGVWQKNERDFSSGKTWWAVKQFRLVLFTARGFNRHDTAIRSAALSFYTVMSLVPILALVFVVFKGFGMEDTFNGYLYELLPNHSVIIDQIVVFINNLLERTRSGVMAVSAFFLLIWAVIKVFGNIEGAFNNIWEVKRSRSFTRRFSGYMAIVIMAPILGLAANSLYMGLRGRLEVFTGRFVTDILFGVVSELAIILMFSMIYFVIPNINVKYKNALKAAIVAGIGFSLFQVAYFWIQGNLSSYNAIYGTFAAIPLFLLWLQVSWQILLFGGELSFAMQNIRDFEIELQSKDMSYDNRCKIMIAMMAIAIRNYLDGKMQSTPEKVAEEIGIPVRTVREVAYELEANGLLLFVRNEKTGQVSSMIPARDPHAIRFYDVINSVAAHGSEMPGMRATAMMKRIDKTYETVKNGVTDSGDNIFLTELIYNRMKSDE